MPDPELRRSSFFEELKRRKVVRVALLYGAAGFALLQGADLVLPRVGLPDWTLTLLTWLLLLGFPIALILSWAFEVSPEGIRATEPAGAVNRPSTPALLDRRSVFAAGALILLGVAFGAGWLLRPAGEAAAGVGAGAETNGRGLVSVAVLPFADLSAERDQEYLGDGLAEELLNVLVRSEAVSVASRTSSFSFKGRALSIPAIARELGVDHIVDGSVRRSGDRLRITAQLVDVRADRPLWSETFDRAADDIFRIQDEIAAAIADALRVRLVGSERPAPGTQDPEAYDLYLLGLYHWNQRTPEGLQRALEVFGAAAERDPRFARAWAGLSLTYRNLPGYAEYDVATARAQARAAAERAVRLDPRSAEARTALGGALWFDRDIAAAQRELEQAIALDPTFATASHWLGILHTVQGRLEDGERSLRRARALDPASLPIQSYLGLNLDMQGRTAEALAEVEALLVRAPEYRNGLSQAFLYGVRLGRAREFEPRLAGYLQALGEDPAQAGVILDGIERPALRPRAIATLEAIAARRPGAGRAGSLAELFMLLDAPAHALALLEQEEDPINYLRLPSFDALRGDPRFQALQGDPP